MQRKKPLLRPGMGSPPSRSQGSQAGCGGFSGWCGDSQAGCPEARTTVTCGSVMLLQVTSSLLYTIKGIYSLMSLKSQGPGRAAGKIK